MTTRPTRRVLLAAGPLALGLGALAACSGGDDAVARPDVDAPAAR